MLTLMQAAAVVVVAATELFLDCALWWAPALFSPRKFSSRAAHG
jgi:hypothetical protein